jgi:hypothetical protein
VTSLRLACGYHGDLGRDSGLRKVTHPNLPKNQGLVDA